VGDWWSTQLELIIVPLTHRIQRAICDQTCAILHCTGTSHGGKDDNASQWKIEKFGSRYAKHSWTQSHRRVIAISVFDLMTLNIALRVALGSGIIFTKFDLRQLIRAWIIAFLWFDTLCHAESLTFYLLTLKVCGHQASRKQSLYEIWAKSSHSRLMVDLANCCRRIAVTLTFDLFIINFYSTSCVMLLNSVQIRAKSNNPPLSCWRFSTFSPCNFMGGARLTNGSQ